MMQTVQLAIADPAYAAALREALTRNGPWQVKCVEAPNLCQTCVLVLDEAALDRMPLPLQHPERVVLIMRKEPERLSRAWNAGIVSVVSPGDAPATVMLAIMATALRVSTAHPGAISPTTPRPPAPIPPESPHPGSKRPKSN